MSVAFFDEKKYLTKVKKAFKLWEADDAFKQIFDERKKNPVFNMAARFVRFNANNNMNFQKLLIGAFKDCNINFDPANLVKKPLIILAKEPNKVRVYPNIPLDITTDEPLKTTCWALNWDVLDTFQQTYMEEYKDPVKKAAWESTPRIWKRIKKYEEMPISRALSRIIAPVGFSEATLAQVSTAFEEQRKPMELTLCETPTDYLTMYASGPTSCMGNGHEKTLGWTPMFKAGIHPTSFYHYHPHMMGVYATQRGSVAGRTILHQKEDGKWYYGRLYASSTKMLEKFRQSLEQKGYICLDPGDQKDRWWDYIKFSRNCEFDIPGVEGNGFWYLPMPYFDTMENSLHASFNPPLMCFILLMA